MFKKINLVFKLVAVLQLCFTLNISHAEEAIIAVASNFSAPMKALVPLFEQESQHRIQATYGATGKFYAQIKQGAPFDALLAADEATPQLLMDNQLAVNTSQFTYAIGRLVLWSNNPALIDGSPQILSSERYKHLAIANPKLAPYGLAAKKVIANLGLTAQVDNRIVMGENIAQTYQFVQTGNAEFGFVALSQVIKNGKIELGSYWQVPSELHPPIKQDAVLLKKGAQNEAAKTFLTFLKSAKARAVIQSYGYNL